MKLSKTQNELVNEMKSKIEYAKDTDIKLWLFKDYKGNNNFNGAITLENMYNKLDKEALEFYKKCYYNLQNNIVIVQTSSNTLKALVNKGVIEVINDGGKWTDTVKLLTI